MPKPVFPVVLSVLVVAACLVLSVFRVVDQIGFARTRIGIGIDDADHGLLVTSLTPDGPAERGGLRAGDVLVAIDGIRVHDEATSRAAFDRVVPGGQNVFEIEREGQTLHLRVYPGMSPEWGRMALDLAVVVLCLAVGSLALIQKPERLQARLLAALLFLVAIEFALPQGWKDVAWEEPASYAFFLLTGLQIAVELHLASVLPRPQGWLVRHPWVKAVYWTIGLGIGVGGAATELVERYGPEDLLPWTSYDAIRVISNWGLPLWAITVITLLALAIHRTSDRQGRLQAAFVLLGDLPWALYTVATTLFLVAGWTSPAWLDTFGPGLTVVYPVAVFVAIFRHHLFDFEVVIRRSLLYAVLTSTLVLVFYAALGAGGAVFSRLVEGEHSSIWVVSAATLLLGLLFSPLRRAVQTFIDGRFFPERQAVRQRLIDLASELPALGRLPLMGQHLVERISRIFAVPSAALLLVDPTADVLMSLAAHGGALGSGRSLLLSPEDPAIVHLRLAGRPRRAAELMAESETLRQRLGPLGIELIAPLIGENRLIGVLLLGPKDRPGDFSSEEIELLGLLAHHVATVFENVRLFQSATYESLTGQLRREAILALLEREADRARRYGRPLAVALADIDHFKAVNDRYGHLGGDGVLRRVAEVLASSIRSSDAIGRYGGEEFLLVFPETDLVGAAVLSEKLRRRIESLSIDMEDGSSVEVRISIGLAHLDGLFPGESAPALALISAADRELYRAKKGGRNRVEPKIARDNELVHA